MTITTSARRRVPSYKLHKPSGQARVIIDGKHCYLGLFGSPESREAYARMIAEHEATPGQPPQSRANDSRLTVARLALIYNEHAEAYYQKNGKPTGHVFRIKRALRTIRELYGHTLARDFGPRALRAVQQRLIRDGVSRGYVNAVCNEIRRAFKWAVSQELVAVAVYQALATVPGLKKGRTKAREAPPVQPVADEMVDRTLPFLPEVLADVIRLQRLLGCRPGEVLQLRPCDIDASGGAWVYRPESHKTEHHGRERRIYIGPQAQDVLRPYLARDAEAYCFSPAESSAKRQATRRATRKTRVQPSQYDRRKRRPKITPGARYHKDALNNAIRRACAKSAGLVRPTRPDDPAGMDAYKAALRAYNGMLRSVCWHPNQLRHAAATRIRQAYGLEAAQVILGHSRADVTQIYAERDHGLAERVAQAIG